MPFSNPPDLERADANQKVFVNGIIGVKFSIMADSTWSLKSKNENLKTGYI